MKNWIDRFLHWSRQLVKKPAELAFEPSWFGRMINALTFTIVILFLGAWITGFVLLEDHFAIEKLPANLLTNLNCIIFFGGLALAIFVGALASNLLRRFFWRLLLSRGMHQ